MRVCNGKRCASTSADWKSGAHAGPHWYMMHDDGDAGGCGVSSGMSHEALNTRERQASDGREGQKIDERAEC